MVMMSASSIGAGRRAHTPSLARRQVDGPDWDRGLEIPVGPVRLPGIGIERNARPEREPDRTPGWTR